MPRQWQESFLNFDRSPDFALKEQIHIPSSKLEEIINRILHEHWVFLSSSYWPLKEFLSGTSACNFGTVWGERNSTFRSPIPHKGRSTSAGSSLACPSSASSTSIQNQTYMKTQTFLAMASPHGLPEVVRPEGPNIFSNHDHSPSHSPVLSR